ncbi:hypothetical protein [Engelhardtia mirabilis]|uniref:Right handed beta helix domain-containing protein n=1 Tax=Engelhardtia mirabilis TaxID=2528011 RepID=A0A518BDX4_9BACT|nr:hypothetical protein Pla133_02520 [Planctomycetes bacterium Pla133]QDU99514.1 hypothetical protein Pla86_02520 [Planctomycetes bacterium Pla86]
MLLTLVTLALAQQSWTIDDDGPADFADLPAAVAAASDGDILQLMPGSYTGTTITKNLKLLGYPPSSFEIPKIGAPGLIVDGSGGGATTFTLTDLRVDDLVLRNLTARTRVDTATVAGLQVESCTDVVVTRSYVSDGALPSASIEVTDSAVRLTTCNITGGTEASTLDGKAGLALWGDSDVRLAGCVLTGGNVGDAVFSSLIPGPAIQVVDGAASVTVHGSSYHPIDGGHDPFSSLDSVLTQAPSVEILGGTLDLSWSAVDFPDAPVPAVSPAEPYLEVGPVGAPLFGPDPTRDLRVFGAPGDVAAVAIAVGSSTSLPTGFSGESLRVNLDQLVVLELLALQGQDVPAFVTVAQPTGPSLSGIELDVQALVALSGGTSFVTNASQIVLK